MLTSAIYLQKFELNKGLDLSKIFPNDYNVITKNTFSSENFTGINFSDFLL